MGRKRQLGALFPSHRRLQLLAFRDSGGHGGKPPPLLVAVGNGNVAASSLDGITWASHAITNANWLHVAWGGSRYVAVGNSVVSYSANGKTWQDGTITARAWAEVAYGDGVFVAVGALGFTAHSEDGGVTWAEVSTPSADSHISVAFGNGTFVAAASNGFVNRSVDGGVTWTRSAASFGGMGTLAFASELSRFISVLGGGLVCRYSNNNGASWTLGTGCPPRTPIGDVKWNGTDFLSVSASVNADGTSYSGDGITWTTPGTKPAFAFTGAAWLVDHWAVISGTRNAFSTSDGISWTNHGVVLPAGFTPTALTVSV
jgi:hypothetical protein